MPRTLLPIFNAFKLISDVYKEEEYETFGWMPSKDQYDYEMAKEVIHTIPGAIIFLTTIDVLYNDDGIQPYIAFNSEIGNKILTSLCSHHHTRESATHLALSYSKFLSDWDNFVLNSKEGYARQAYDESQLSATDIQPFLRLNYKETLISPILDEMREKLLKKEVERLRSVFNIQHDYETTYTMLIELGKEKSEEAVA